MRRCRGSALDYAAAQGGLRPPWSGCRISGNASSARLVVLFLLFGCWFASPCVATSGTRDILLLQSAPGGVYAAVAEAVEARLRSTTCGAVGACRLQRGETPELLDPAADLIVTLGRQAALAVARQGPKAAVIYALLPQALYKELHPARDTAADTPMQYPRSALFVDQPPRRRIRLIRVALPEATRVGLVAGPQSRPSAAALAAEAARQGIALHSAEIDDSDQLGAVLRGLLGISEVLLALPAPMVNNKRSAMTLLLGSYRAGVPVVAYSRAFVTAGALMAVYTTPEQFGRQIARMIVHFLDHAALPQPLYPSRFSVAVNPAVARSLRLDIPGAEDLERMLRETTP